MTFCITYKRKEEYILKVPKYEHLLYQVNKRHIVIIEGIMI